MPNPIALIFKSYPKRIGDLWSFTFCCDPQRGIVLWQFKSRLLLLVFVTTGDIFLGIPLLYQSGMHFFGLSERGIISGERVSPARFRAEMVFLSGKFKCNFLLSFSFSGKSHFGRWTGLLALIVLYSMMTFLYAPQLDLGLTEGDRPFYQEMVLQLPRPSLWWPALLEWIGLGSLLCWTTVLLLSQLHSNQERTSQDRNSTG